MPHSPRSHCSPGTPRTRPRWWQSRGRRPRGRWHRWALKAAGRAGLRPGPLRAAPRATPQGQAVSQLTGSAGAREAGLRSPKGAAGLPANLGALCTRCHCCHCATEWQPTWKPPSSSDGTRTGAQSPSHPPAPGAPGLPPRRLAGISAFPQLRWPGTVAACPGRAGDRRPCAHPQRTLCGAQVSVCCAHPAGVPVTAQCEQGSRPGLHRAAFVPARRWPRTPRLDTLLSHRSNASSLPAHFRGAQGTATERH